MVTPIVVGLRVDDRTAAALRKAGGRVQQFGKTVDGTRARMVELGQASSTAAGRLAKFATAFAGIAAGRAALRTLQDFDEEIRQLQGVTGATGAEFDVLANRARELGAATRFTATQAAEGMKFLARAGLEAGQTVAAIGSTLDLATASQLDLGRASDLAANTIKQFSLRADEAGRVADVFVATSNKTNTNVEQLGQAFRLTGVAASAMGVPLEETASALGVLADRGAKATLGGTSLRRILLGLSATTKGARDTLRQMGLTQADVDIKTQGLAGAMANLRDKGLGVQQAVGLFGIRFAAAGLILAQNADRINDLTGELKGAGGAARDFAAIMERSLRGRVLALVSALQEATLQVGDAGFKGALQSTLDVMADAVRILTGMERSLETASAQGEKLARVLKVLAVVASAAVASRLAIFFLDLGRGMLEAAKAAVTLNATMTRTVVGQMVKLGLAISAVAVGFDLLGQNIDRASVRFDQFGKAASFLEARLQQVTESQRLIEFAVETGDAEKRLLGLQQQMRALQELQIEIIKGRVKVPELIDRKALEDADVMLARIAQIRELVNTTKLGFFLGPDVKPAIQDLEAVALAMKSIEAAQEGVRRAARSGPEASAGLLGLLQQDATPELRAAVAELGRAQAALDALNAAGQSQTAASKLNAQVIGALEQRIRGLGQAAGVAGDAAEKLGQAKLGPLDVEAQRAAQRFAEITEALENQATNLRAVGVAQKALTAIANTESAIRRQLTAAERAEIVALVRDVETLKAARGARDLAEGLREQALMARFSAMEQEQLNNVLELRNILAQAGIPITAEQIAKTAELTAATQDLAIKQQLAAQLATDLNQSLSQSLSDVAFADNSEEIEEIFRNMGERIGKQMLDQLIGSFIRPATDLIGAMAGELIGMFSTSQVGQSAIIAEAGTLAGLLNTQAKAAGLLASEMVAADAAMGTAAGTAAAVLEPLQGVAGAAATLGTEMVASAGATSTITAEAGAVAGLMSEGALATGALAAELGIATGAAFTLGGEIILLGAELALTDIEAGALASSLVAAAGAAGGIAVGLLASNLAMLTLGKSAVAVFTIIEAGAATLAVQSALQMIAVQAAATTLLSTLSGAAVASAIATAGTSLSFGPQALAQILAAKASVLALGEGALVLPKPGGVPAILAEKGEAELVIPLSQMKQFIAANKDAFGFGETVGPDIGNQFRSAQQLQDTRDQLDGRPRSGPRHRLTDGPVQRRRPSLVDPGAGPLSLQVSPQVRVTDIAVEGLEVPRAAASSAGPRQVNLVLENPVFVGQTPEDLAREVAALAMRILQDELRAEAF